MVDSIVHMEVLVIVLPPSGTKSLTQTHLPPRLLLIVSVTSSMHCSHVGPHLGTRVPMGTFFRFWVPIGSPFFFKVPIFSISGLRTRENSVQPPSNVDHLIIQCKWHKHCALNEDTLCLCEYFLFKKKLASSMN